MTNVTSNEQKEELFKTIWAVSNELRGSVDGWDFKNYVLGFLFYRYISENITNYINNIQEEAGEVGFNYADFNDEEAKTARDQMIQELGFFILPSQLFCNVAKNAPTNEILGDTLAIVFNAIENSAMGSISEDAVRGLFGDVDVMSNKLGATEQLRNEMLRKIMNRIGSLDLKCDFTENEIDVFGDAYEYLMNMYASNAGKSGGEFFTPQEVSELLAKMTTQDKKSIRKVYDPTCGSGSLLLQIAKVLGDDSKRVHFYGQEKNITTYNLCRMNMFLHNVGYNHFDIKCGDTLTHPYCWNDVYFDAIVSNPPYSIKWDGDSNPLLVSDPRFTPAGVLAPKSKADLAFVMHILSCLDDEGTAAIVEFPGVLYRGGAEKKIRKYLIENNFVDTVIQLPANLFFGVTIATCIIVLKKSRSDSKTLFIDASKEFVHIGNKNRLSEENISNILNEYVERDEIQHFSALVDREAIADNDYNLSVSNYVEAEDTREKIDIKAVNSELRDIVEATNKLREEINQIIEGLEG